MRVAITFWKTFHSVGAVLLAVAYLTGTARVDLVHSLSHSHDLTVSHTVEAEKDPCHRLIYHDDKTRGCHHDAHIVTDEKCALCDLACQSDVALLQNVVLDSGVPSCTTLLSLSDDLNSLAFIISSSRAPPFTA